MTPTAKSTTMQPGAGPSRLACLMIGFVLAAVIVALGGLLPIDSFAAVVLFDHRAKGFPPYPVTISCIEWLVFGIGAGELFHNYLRARGEREQLGLTLLPEEEDVMLDPRSLVDFTQRIKTSASSGFHLQRILLRTIWQFQSTGSISQATSIMDRTLELSQHELDLRYNVSRYITWVLPTIGFMGTVWGLSRGLAGLSSEGLDPSKTEQFKQILRATIGDLSVAFNATLIALILSSILVLAMQLIQEFEEHSLNDAGQYCIDHLINKLYVVT